MQKFEVFRTHDDSVSKYVHVDGSETAIKLVKSIQSILNPITNQIETRESDRNKYSIFISSSVGCFMKCRFCHLTLKKSTHEKLSEDQVLSNLKEAIEEASIAIPDIKNRYIKLSWMGMGDAVNKPEMVRNVSLKILDWIFEKGYAIGLDGVDLSTVMPKLNDKKWIGIFHDLESSLHKYVVNPIYTMDNVEFANNQYSHQNIFRIFYSIGSPIQEKRDNVIPNAMPLSDASTLFKEYQQDGKYSVILHHLLVNNMNDSHEELDKLIEFINTNFKDNELRLLRYNSCKPGDINFADGIYVESDTINEQIKKISDNINFLKVQISPGSQVQAACGQFIVKDFIRTKPIYPTHK